MLRFKDNCLLMLSLFLAYHIISVTYLPFLTITNLFCMNTYKLSSDVKGKIDNDKMSKRF